jgi:probable F420-dependent oxidoreductase
VRFGLALPHYDTSLAGQAVTWDGVKRVAQTAERSGFDSVWVSDHLFLDWGKYGGPSDPQGSLECWTTLSAIGASTTSVRLGSLTLCNDLRSPALVAKMAASLDQLSGGRVDVGLGAGWYEPEYEAAGVPFDDAKTRISRLGEAAHIVSRLLEGEEVTFAGDHYQLDGAIVRPGPRQEPRPPVWIGGKGNLLLKQVAKHADGWNYSWLGSFETYEERVQAAEKACEAEGRDPKTLKRSAGVYLLAGTDEADLKRRFERLAERTPTGVLPSENGGAAVSWEAFRRDRVAGTVSEVIDRLGQLSELGVDEVIVTIGALPFQLGDEEDVELVGSEIASVLK